MRFEHLSPTPFDELNAVLAELVRALSTLFGDNLLGAYLQGSFAVGNFDERSDVDFMIVTREDITEINLPALQALHAAIYERPSRWAQRLEGSYAPVAVLRRWAETPRDPPGLPPRPSNWADPGTSGSPPRVYPFLFLNNGANALVRSEHDNTRVVRWVTREKGVVLTGPSPRELIDPVSAEALRGEVRAGLTTFATPWLADPAKMNKYWLQAFFMVLYCRMLHTLATGEVASKKAGTIWARTHLDSRWHALIERAWNQRFAPLASWSQPANPLEVAETLAFMRYAMELARDV
jgi:hypothetical protein